MSKRQWCPMIWMDEIVTVQVADPSECIVFADGRWLLTDDEWRETNGIGGETVDLTPGEIVKFGYGEAKGRVEVIRHPDGGGFTHIASTPIPTDANSWWLVGDGLAVSDTLAELVRDHIEPGSQALVEAYRWVFRIPFAFQVEDGKGCFVQCEGMA